jgi:hypothetical protein
LRTRREWISSIVIPDASSVGDCRLEAQASDVQLHIGESITTAGSMDSGLAPSGRALRDPLARPGMTITKKAAQ